MAALLDLDRAGVRSEALLRDTIARLHLEVEIEVAAVAERGVRATRVTTRETASPPLRTLRDLESIIQNAALSGAVAAQSLAALRRLARIEGDLHGAPPEHVHFHEVGACDTLVDVVGAFLLVDLLGVERVECGPVPVGSGRVEVAHGVVGLPAPATLSLLEGVPVFAGPESSEVTTPTGALLLTELADAWGPMPLMTPRVVGYGAGSRRLAHGPNLLRAVIGDSPSTVDPSGADAPEVGLVLLETTIDDATPEALGHLQARALEAGARDVWTSPVFMKKGRPGVLLSVLTDHEAEDRLVDLVFSESGTFGIRRRGVERHVLERSFVPVMVDGQPVRVKVGRRRGAVVSVTAEYEEAARAATELGRPLREVMREAVDAARRLLRE